MSKTPSNLANLPPDVQVFVAAQAAELARKDAELLGLTLSHASTHKRLSDAIRDHVFEAQAIFMEDTTVKLLQKGKGRGKNKSKTARIWVYACQ